MTEIKIHRAVAASGGGGGGGLGGTLEIFRKTLHFEGYADTAAFNASNDWKAIVPSGGSWSITAPKTSWSGSPWTYRSKVLRLQTPAANGSTTHTGSNWDLILHPSDVGSTPAYGSNIEGNLFASLGIQIGDVVRFTYHGMYDVQSYSGSDAGTFIYPGIMYSQREDWRGMVARTFVGDWYMGGVWTPPMQDAQWNYYYSGSAWERYPFTAAFECEINEAAFNYSPEGNLTPAMCFTLLWAENFYECEISELDILVFRGQS